MKEKNNGKAEKGLSTAFIWFHATSANGTAMAISATIATYFSLYVQQTIGVTAAQLSVILLICSSWDAVSTPIMGVLCDSIHWKWGRYRTWFTFTPVLLLIDMFVLFSNPGFIQQSAMAKCVYICAAYLCYGTIVTAYTMPHTAILPAMTMDDAARNDVLSKGAGVCALMFTIASSFSTQFVKFFGSYRTLMCLYAALSIISFWGLFKTSSERFAAPKGSGGGIRQLACVFRHREIWPVMLCWCLSAISYGLMFSSSVYYVGYYLKRPDLTTQYMLFVSMGALVSMAVLMPMFLRKFHTGWKAMLVSQAGTVALYLLLYFTGGMSFWWVGIVSFLATAIGAMVNALTNVLVNDAIDFILLKEEKQLNGIIASVKGFAQKCGTTITNSGMLAILAVFGFNTELGMEQPESAVNACNLIRFLLPALVSAVILMIMVFYPLKKYFPEIAEMKARLSGNAEDNQML